MLNRPLRGTAAELEAAGMFGRSTNISATSLAGQPIYAGGPDILETGVLTVLHGEERLAETTEMRQPLEGVFVGDAIKFLERETDADISKIRVFTGCIRWGPGKLEKEVDDGLWYCVSASNLYALKHCIQLPKPLWVEIMQSQGQPFSQIASQVYKDESESEDEL